LESLKTFSNINSYPVGGRNEIHPKLKAFSDAVLRRNQLDNGA
jgi:hypothetical protein